MHEGVDACTHSQEFALVSAYIVSTHAKYIVNAALRNIFILTIVQVMLIVTSHSIF